MNAANRKELDEAKAVIEAVRKFDNLSEGLQAAERGRNRTARAERIVDVVLADFGQAMIRISMRDAMVAACAAALIDREEGQQTPCLSALASGEACQPDESLMRCAICGFVIDVKFAAEKPTVRMRP